MLPCAIRPRVSTSNQYTPRWPTQIRPTPSGSGMMTAVGAAGRHPAALGQPRHAGVAAALLVHRAAHLHGAGELDARAADRVHGEDGRRDARLHVARPAPVDPAVAHEAAERVHGPPVSGRDDVEVAVEVDEGASPRRRGGCPPRSRGGGAAVCSGRPSAPRYSTSQPARASRSPIARAQSA